MAVDHYENFPVASLLLPKHLRRAVTDIYRFARGADDVADEGDARPSERKAALQTYRQAILTIEQGAKPEAPFAPLAQTMAQHHLPAEPFLDLLSAFEQDIEQTRYEDYSALLDYCRRSANPVGTLMLYLYKTTDAHSMTQSAAICSALQLINFLQDVAIDWQKDRIYLPLEDLKHFGVTEQHIAQAKADTAWRALMQFQVDRARGLLNSGLPLGKTLSGRIGLELRLIIQGGLRILEKIEHIHFDVFRHRPILRPWDWILMLWRAL
ncbi:MAG: squalene synthase HpnC [Burkholderiaceae bacterium]|jgi:squalene synthase HpnC|nr:squalene synthase HpnC [Burkholderiaceae bacterium]MDP4969428.1 squalene synthase HpnC [Burkholderiaceae bacterium]MDP5111450.1 squalene synthase HpnC [Burkholderiaceae bacterium]